MRRLAGGCAIGCGLLLVACLVLGVIGVNWLRSTYLSPKLPDPRLGKSVALRPTFVLGIAYALSPLTPNAHRLRLVP
jgi:hypothetical protein